MSDLVGTVYVVQVQICSWQALKIFTVDAELAHSYVTSVIGSG